MTFLYATTAIVFIQSVLICVFTTNTLYSIESAKTIYQRYHPNIFIHENSIFSLKTVFIIQICIALAVTVCGLYFKDNVPGVLNYVEKTICVAVIIMLISAVFSFLAHRITSTKLSARNCNCLLILLTVLSCMCNLGYNVFVFIWGFN